MPRSGDPFVVRGTRRKDQEERLVAVLVDELERLVPQHIRRIIRRGRGVVDEGALLIQRVVVVPPAWVWDVRLPRVPPRRDGRRTEIRHGAAEVVLADVAGAITDRMQSAGDRVRVVVGRRPTGPLDAVVMRPQAGQDRRPAGTADGVVDEGMVEAVPTTLRRDLASQGGDLLHR